MQIFKKIKNYFAEYNSAWQELKSQDAEILQKSKNKKERLERIKANSLTKILKK